MNLEMLMLGLILAISAACGFGMSVVFARIGMANARPTSVAVVSTITGMVVVLTIAIILNWTEIISLKLNVIPILALCGIFNFVIGRLLSYTGISLSGVSKTAPIVGTAPIFSMIFAISIGGENLTSFTLLATMSVAAGIALIMSEQQ